ncbi:MAG: cytochrome P450 [Cyanobacteria bacterium]|nr:cytochrome P450 [Cyanobacteriota bacterium]MDW8202221.1 cytochrome P450 [Cyanobacteriota bacterium SKYGB_h_bin112]
MINSSAIYPQPPITLPPGPTLPGPLQTARIILQPIAFLEDCARRYGDVFTLRVLGINSPPVVFVSNPQGIQAIFTTLANRLALGKVTYVFQPLTGSESLIMQDGKRHHRQRQLLMPALHGEQLPHYAAMIQEVTRHHLAAWSCGAPVNIRQAMADISLDIILRVVFGMAPGHRYHQLKPRLHHLLEYVTSPVYSVQFFLPLLQRNLGRWSPWGRFQHLLAEIDALIYAEIHDRRGQPQQQSRVLDLLLTARDEAGQPMTDQELRDQLMTLLLLGHETTASALTWALYWIHSQPDIRSNLMAELATVQDGHPIAITNLPYLKAVCAETLRVYPIALIAQPRVAQTPITLTDYHLPSGTVLVPCIYNAHRRSDIFPCPEEFQPDRFLNHRFSPYEYLPFGGGNRSCIGMALSLFEMKLVLATLMSTYQMAIAPPLDQPHQIRAQRRGITFVPDSRFQLQVMSQLESDRGHHP